MGDIAASTGDNKNHVVKIVCGKGNHSNGRAVLKFAVPLYLVSLPFLNIIFSKNKVTISITMTMMALSSSDSRLVFDQFDIKKNSFKYF